MSYKICHVFPFFSIRYFGGTSDWMYKLTKAQAKAGMEPTILSGDYLFDQELADTIPEVKFRVLKSYLDKAGFSLVPKLWQFGRQELSQFDIVHMHVFRTFQNIVLYYYCRRQNIPYIIDAHGAVPYYTRKRFLKRCFDALIGRRMLRNAAALVAETRVGVEEYKAILNDLNDEDVITISPPFDTEEFQNLPERGLFRKKLNIAPEKKLIMFLGRVHWIKGNDYLIKAFAELRKKRDDVVLAIVGGDDGHMEECKNLVQELGLQNDVHFPGFLAAENKLSALVDAEIMVQLSRHEQGAWAPIEAVLAGTPALVSDHTGAGEDMRRLEAGYTAIAEDPEDVSTKLDGILNDYASAKALTLKAAKWIEKNSSMDARLSEFSTLYDSCSQHSDG